MEIVREELRIIPATFERVQYIRESCICPQCKEEDDEVVVKKAATPTPLIPHSLASCYAALSTRERIGKHRRSD